MLYACLSLGTVPVYPIHGCGGISVLVSLCRRRRRFRTEYTYSWTRGRKGRAKWAVQLGSGKRAARMRRDWIRPGSSTGPKVGEGSGCAVQDRQALITPMPSSHGPQLCSAWCRGAGGLCWLQIPRQGREGRGRGQGVTLLWNRLVVVQTDGRPSALVSVPVPSTDSPLRPLR